MNEKNTFLCGHGRIVIANIAQAAKRQMKIAEALGCSLRTISKELEQQPWPTRISVCSSRPIGQRAEGQQKAPTEGDVGRGRGGGRDA